MSQNSDPFAVNDEAARKLNDGMDLGGGIELPFSAPVFWWMNGSPQSRALAQSTPAVYFGGWASNADSIEAVQDDRGGVPGGLIQTEIYTREGKTISAYTCRGLVVAPIGFRSCWVIGQRGAQVRSVAYQPGGRQHIQVLALMGVKVENSYQSWGPVVLSAKGYQAQYIQTALKDWTKALDRPRREHAKNVPAWAFWCALGTFGQQPTVIQVGKSGSTSPITPVELHVPKVIDREMMIKLFVGREGVDEMAALLDEADEWLNAWKNQSGQAQAAPAGSGYGEDDFPLEPVGNFSEDEIPF